MPLGVLLLDMLFIPLAETEPVAAGEVVAVCGVGRTHSFEVAVLPCQ